MLSGRGNAHTDFKYVILSLPKKISHGGNIYPEVGLC